MINLTEKNGQSPERKRALNDALRVSSVTEGRPFGQLFYSRRNDYLTG